MSKLTPEIVAAGLREALRIQRGYVPTEADLAGAPRLGAWTIEPMSGGLYRLTGHVSGHPRLPEGWCSTSVLLAIDPDERWARTVSRYYVLGPAFSERVGGD